MRFIANLQKMNFKGPPIQTFLISECLTIAALQFSVTNKKQAEIVLLYKYIYFTTTLKAFLFASVF